VAHDVRGVVELGRRQIERLEGTGVGPLGRGDGVDAPGRLAQQRVDGRLDVLGADAVERHRHAHAGER